MADLQDRQAGIVVFLMMRLVRELEPEARRTLVGTAVLIFVFRALPGPGAGSTWWMIDDLGFDQEFLARLSLIGSTLTLFGLFLLRRFMAERSIASVVIFLTLTGTVLALPILGMFHGLHEWTAARTGGVVDARFIALVDTALESPLGQIAMVPMLTWIASSAPARLKATYFAVMASFTNLALSAAQLGTKYLNRLFVATREVKDPASGAVSVPADYAQLGDKAARAMIEETARTAYRALWLRDYARLDIRLTAKGEVWFIEANANPFISYGHDVASAAVKAGMNYYAFIQRIVDEATARYERA